MSMAENLTFDNEAIDHLYLTNGVTKGGLIYLIITIIFGHLSMIVPLVIITLLYKSNKKAIHKHVKRCRHCTDPTPNGRMCEQFKTKKVRFCRTIERWTAWLLVDLFRTPNVGKEMDNSKVHLKLWEKRSLVLGEESVSSGLLFTCISYIFVFYTLKFLGDLFLKLTPTCISKGDFGIPAACYALDTSHIDNSSTSQIYYQINCTTWNDNLESLGEEIGLLFCFSLYYNTLTSVTEIMGLFGLQTVVVQVTLIVAEKCTHLVEKYTQRTEQICKQCCIATLISFITFAVFIFIIIIIPTLTVFTNLMNTKQIYEVFYRQQFLPMQIVCSSIILATYLMFLTDKDGKTKEETRNMRDRDKIHIHEALYQQVLPTDIANSSRILAKLLMPLTDKDGKTPEDTCNTRDHDEEPVEQEEDTPV